MIGNAVPRKLVCFYSATWRTPWSGELRADGAARAEARVRGAEPPHRASMTTKSELESRAAAVLGDRAVATFVLADLCRPEFDVGVRRPASCASVPMPEATVHENGELEP